jgi:uncharacterized protein (TIGR01370 family)
VLSARWQREDDVLLVRNLAVVYVAYAVLVFGCCAAEEKGSKAAPPKASDAKRALSAIKSFCYYFGDDVEACAKAPYDLVVLDTYEMDAGKVALVKSAGKEVLSYVNAGAIERWRKGLWQEGWEVGKPAFLLAKYPGWPDEVLVDISDPEWRKIVFGWIDAQLAKGVDGIFLDNIAEGYRYQEDAHVLFPVDRAKAREYVKAIRQHVGDSKLLFVNQGLEILHDEGEVKGTKRYIDGVMQEDLFYSVAQKDLRSNAELEHYFTYLDPFRRMGKLVLVVDYPYPDRPDLAGAIKAAAKAKGYLAYLTDIDMRKIY